MNPIPNVEGLLPKQIEILHTMMVQVLDCEDDIPMEYWCEPCFAKYIRLLELIHRWRKMGTRFVDGKWWCNHAPLTKYSTDTRYTFVCKDEDDLDAYTTFFNYGEK